MEFHSSTMVNPAPLDILRVTGSTRSYRIITVGSVKWSMLIATSESYESTFLQDNLSSLV